MNKAWKALLAAVLIAGVIVALVISTTGGGSSNDVMPGRQTMQGGDMDNSMPGMGMSGSTTQ